MRLFFLIFLFSCLPLLNAEEKFTLDDGRVFIGTYDDEKMVISFMLDEIKGQVRVEPNRIIKRELIRDPTQERNFIEEAKLLDQKQKEAQLAREIKAIADAESARIAEIKASRIRLEQQQQAAKDEALRKQEHERITAELAARKKYRDELDEASKVKLQAESTRLKQEQEQRQFAIDRLMKQKEERQRQEFLEAKKLNEESQRQRKFFEEREINKRSDIKIKKDLNLILLVFSYHALFLQCSSFNVNVLRSSRW